MGKISIVGKLKKEIMVDDKLININDSVNDLSADFLIELFADSKEEIGYESDTKIRTHSKDFKEEIIRYAKRTLKYNNKEFVVALARKTYIKSVLIECSIEYREESIISESFNESKLFDTVYEFKIKIKKWMNKFCKEIYWIYDDNNAEICTIGYQKIHCIENKFRQVLSLFMMRKCGDIYLNKDLTDEFNKYSNFYKESEYEDFKNINSKLYNISFSKLPDLLNMKVSQVIVEEEKSIKDIVDETIEILSDVSDMTYSYKSIENEKKKLKSKLNKINREEFLFSSKILSILDNGFKDKWNKLSGMRNMVMHNKPICQRLFNDISDMCNFMQNKFKECLDDIENCFYTEEESVYDALCDEEYENQQFKFEYIERLREECGIEFQLDEYYVMDELRENSKQIDELMTVLSNINDLSSKVEELYDNCDRIRDYLNSLEKKKILEYIISICTKLEIDIEDFDVENESEDLVEEFIESIINHIDMENLYDNLVENNHVDDEFSICKEIAEFSDYKGEIYELQIQGELNPEDYGFDYIECILYKNKEVLKKSEIEVFYGSYENQSEGYINCDDINEINIEIIDIYDDMEEKVVAIETNIEKTMKLLSID